MIKSRRGKSIVVTVMIAVVAVASVWSLSVAEDGGPQRFDDKKDDSVKAIERRLEALEKLVGSSRTPVSGRIDVLEKGLRDLTRAMGGTGWSSVESNLREARKALEEQREFVKRAESELAKIKREMDGMDRRLKRLETRS